MHVTGHVPVGRVIGLWRYPVKSMKSEVLSAVDVGWHGLTGDRRWAFVREGVQHSGFPWLTLRERPDMGLYVPSFLDPTQPDKSATIVQTPTGSYFDVADPALAEELCPGGSRVIRQDRGVFDTFPLSIITTQSIARLGKMAGVELSVHRFRPNILVDAANDMAFAEDAWVGQVLRIGDLRVRIDKRDGRCAVITIDPVTTQRSPGILRAVAANRQGCLGVYGSTVTPGRIALNDPVHIEPGDSGNRQ
jgi:uncharacterized protein